MPLPCKSAGIGASEVLEVRARGQTAGRRGGKARLLVGIRPGRPAPPAIGFAVCQQHFPENFWNPAFQQHANTASGVAGVVLVAENPTDHHIFLSAFTGVRDLHATSSGVSVATPQGDIKVMDPAAFRSHFGTEPPDISQGARLAALQFHVRDRSALRAALSGGGIAFSVRMDSTIVAPQSAMGATLVFE